MAERGTEGQRGDSRQTDEGLWQAGRERGSRGSSRGAIAEEWEQRSIADSRVMAYSIWHTED